MDVNTINEKFDLRKTGGVMAGLLYSGEGGILSSHWHEELEIVYTLSGGGGLHYINGTCYDADERELLVINSNFVHSVIPRSGTAGIGDPAVLVMIIDMQFLKCNFPSYDRFYFTNSDRAVNEEIAALLNEIRSCAEQFKPGCADILHRNALILELLSQLSRTRIISRSEIDCSGSLKEIERIKKIVEFIEAHYAEPLTREAVAKHFYLNSTYFSSYFKKYAGQTFTQYLTNYRLEKASRMLIQSDDQIGEIALKCGFSDHRSFISAFKKRFEDTPSRYRKMIEKSDKSEKQADIYGR